MVERRIKMSQFNTEYILEKIAEMEDGQNSMSDIFYKGEVPGDVDPALLSLIDMADVVTVMDYADIGQNGYDAFGVFTFLPDVEDDPCRILSIVITLTEEVNPVGIYDLYQVMNRINVRIPGGAFVISDDEKTMYYRTYVTLPKDVSDEETLKNAGLRVFDSIAAVNDWIDVLMGLNDGDLSYEESIKIVS